MYGFLEGPTSRAWGSSGINAGFSNLPYTDLTHLVYLVLAALIVFTLPNTHQITLGNRKRIWPLLLAFLIFAASVPYIVSKAGQTIPFVYFQF